MALLSARDRRQDQLQTNYMPVQNWIQLLNNSLEAETNETWNPYADVDIDWKAKLGEQNLYFNI